MMFKFLRSSRKKGIALPEYVLIAAVFAIPIGLAVFQMNKDDNMKNYFIKSVDPTASETDGMIKIRPLGE